METTIRINNINTSVKSAGKGQTIILIHGIFATKEIMNPLFDYYKDTHHVISYDVRGHGKSDKPDNFDLDDYADDLKALTDQCQIKKPVIVGLSMGSYIALKTAEKYPDLPGKIVLIGTRGKGEISLMKQENKNYDLKEMGRDIFKRLYPPDTTPEDVEAYYRGNRGETRLTEKERKNIYASLAHYDMMSDIRNVKVPVLLLVGEFDGVNPPEESRKVHNSLENSRMKIIPGAGHVPYFENRDCVIKSIDEFITRT